MSDADGLADDLSVTDLSEHATVRLLPTACYQAPVPGPLVDDESDLELLALIEGLTNRRLRAEREGLPGLDVRELAYGAWGARHVNAAFAYTHPDGNRFDDDGRGAGYAAFLVVDVVTVDERGGDDPGDPRRSRRLASASALRSPCIHAYAGSSRS